MTPLRWALLFTLLFAASFLPAQCTNDHRENKNAGIIVTDFTIAGTQSISATDLASITGEMIGSCYNEDSEEMEERVRASFQNRGYFQVEVKSLRVKPQDPLAAPKPVTLEGEVSEGPQYRLAQVTFLKNHAFAAEELREQFPLKNGALMERAKIALGLESLRNLYAKRGYLDLVSVPETTFGSNAIVNLNVTVDEGPQYHMGKLDIVADKEASARLRAEWKLAEGDVYDRTYIDDYLTVAHDVLPPNFTRADVQITQNCPEALVHVRLIVDPAQDTSKSEPKNVPCEEHDKTPK
jgi:outer membrane protein assembly factor BamA